MKLGILVNTNKHLDDVLGITSAAVAKGHTVNIFIMDDGTRLLLDDSFTALCKTEGVKMSFCDHSASGLGTKPDELTEEIACGSQFDNATMNHDSDKVIVL
jgi:predicted peroxiredoxin